MDYTTHHLSLSQDNKIKLKKLDKKLKQEFPHFADIEDYKTQLDEIINKKILLNQLNNNVLQNE